MDEQRHEQRDKQLEPVDRELDVAAITRRGLLGLGAASAVAAVGSGLLRASPASGAVCNPGPVYKTDEHGVLADGSDASAALASLLDGVPSGAVICFAGGTYNLATWSGYALAKSITLTAFDGTVTLQGPAAPQDFISISQDASASSTRIVIDGMGFDRWDSTNAFTNSRPYDRVTLRGCRFTNVGSSIVALGPQGSLDLHKISELQIRGCLHQGIASKALRIQQGFDLLRIVENRFVDVGSSAIVVGDEASGFGAEEELWKKAVISHNTFEMIATPTIGESIHAISAVGRELVVSENRIEYVENGGGEGAEGIRLRGRYSEVCGNSLRDAGQLEGAISVRGNPRSDGSPDRPRGYANRICGNTITNTRAGDYRGIHVSVEDVLIAENYIEGLRYGIRCEVTVPEAALVIEQNHLHDVSTGIHLLWHGSQLLVQQNLIHLSSNAAEDGISLELGGAATLHDMMIARNAVVGDASANGRVAGFTLGGPGQNVEGLLVRNNRFASLKTGLDSSFGGMPSFSTNGGWVQTNFFRNVDTDISTDFDNQPGSLVVENNRSMYRDQSPPPPEAAVPGLGIAGAAALAASLVGAGIGAARR